MSSTVTLDESGALVLPQAIRDRFQLKPGSHLRIEVGVDCLQLLPESDLDAETTVEIVEEAGLKVIHAPQDINGLDTVAAIAADRDARESRIRS